VLVWKTFKTIVIPHPHLDLYSWRSGLFVASHTKKMVQFLKKFLPTEKWDFSPVCVDRALEAARLIQAQLAQPHAPFSIIEDGLEQQLSKLEMTELFKTHINKAATLIQKTGYHRRDAELAAMKENALYVSGKRN